MKWLLYCSVLVLCTSCLPTDEAIAPFPRSGTSTLQAALGNTYAEQMFVDLATNSIVLKQPITSWHISIDCAPGLHDMHLNDALTMTAANTHETDWLAVTSADYQPMLFDSPTGIRDSNALLEAWPTDTSMAPVFVVHAGYDHNGTDLGYYKVQTVNVSDVQATVRVGKLDGTTDVTLSVPFDGPFRRIGINLSNAAVVHMEPRSDAWDLLLTRYTYVFNTDGQIIPYSVVGALVQQPLTRSVRVQQAFQDVKPADTVAFPLTTHRDGIGYDWKYFNLNTNTYTVDTTAVYLIQDRYGYLRALRFIDFYDQKGVKGTISMEHRLL